MLLHIAKKELKEALRDSRFHFMAGLVVILLLFSMVVSWNNYQKINKEFVEAATTARQQWDTQKPKNPHSAAHFGTFAFKPIQPLSLIDNGLDKYLGVSVFLEGHKQNNAEYKQISEQNDFARFAELTPAFVFTYLMPLLIILLAFNVFTQEKENGTLRLLLSQGVSNFQIGFGKILGIYMVLGLLLVPIFALGVVFILMSNYQIADFLSYGMMLLSLIFYYTIFINVAIGVSAIAKSSNVALISLLGFWIMSALLVPKINANLSKNIYKTPSSSDYQAEITENLEKGVDGHNPFSKQSKIFKDSVLKANKVDSVHKLPFNYMGLSMQAGEEHETVVYAKALKKLNDIYLSQLKVHELSSVFSPTILIKILSMQFAKTDLQAHYEFSRQAENYRIALVRDLNYDFKDNAGKKGFSYISEDKDFFKKTIKFEYKSTVFGQIMQNVSITFLFLSFWVILSIFFVFISLKKL